jgi:hypothetical protein
VTGVTAVAFDVVLRVSFCRHYQQQQQQQQQQ